MPDTQPYQTHVQEEHTSDEDQQQQQQYHHNSNTSIVSSSSTPLQCEKNNDNNGSYNANIEESAKEEKVQVVRQGQVDTAKTEGNSLLHATGRVRKRRNSHHSQSNNNNNNKRQSTPWKHSLCDVCKLEGKEGRYRCPKCLIQYCSVACYKKHKTECTEKPSTSPSSHSNRDGRPPPRKRMRRRPPTVDYHYPYREEERDQYVVSSILLRSLRDDPDIRNAVSDKRLQVILRYIDGRKEEEQIEEKDDEDDDNQTSSTTEDENTDREDNMNNIKDNNRDNLITKQSENKSTRRADYISDRARMTRLEQEIRSNPDFAEFMQKVLRVVMPDVYDDEG